MNTEQDDQAVRVAHSIRFRRVSNRYPRMVAEAYGGDLAAASADSDEVVAARVAAWEAEVEAEGVRLREIVRFSHERARNPEARFDVEGYVLLGISEDGADPDEELAASLDRVSDLLDEYKPTPDATIGGTRNRMPPDVVAEFDRLWAVAGPEVFGEQ